MPEGRSQKNIFYLTLGGITVGIAALAALNVFLFSNVARENEAFQQIRLDQAKANGKRDFITEIEEERKKIEGITESTRAAFYVEKNSFAFSRALSDMASSTHVTLKIDASGAANPFAGPAAPPAKESGLQPSHSFNLQVQGTYADIMRFLTVLEYMQPITIVENIKMEKANTGLGASAATGPVFATISIGLFAK